MASNSYQGDSIGRPVSSLRDTQQAKCEPARKPTAAEYTEKRLSEVEGMLNGELQRIAGQYSRLREHFGIPPEPCNAECAPKEASSGGMDYQINRIHCRVQEIMEIVTKMNELI